MHHAPTVTYPLGRPASLSLVLWALWALSAIPVVWMLFWALALDGPAQAAIVSIVICVFVWLGAGGALRQFWRMQQAECSLRWDGADWWLEEGPTATGTFGTGPVRMEVRLDLQRILLLRWRAQGARRARWFWVERAADPTRWHLLRCALYSKPSRPAPDPLAMVSSRA